MRNTHFATASILLGLCAVATCAEPTPGSVEARHHHFPDAAVTPSADAATTSPPPAGTVSCYTEGAPTATCTLPEHCCFTNYSAQHDGSCETSTCTYGTISCDGPEDCGQGEHCCAHAIIDPNEGLEGYTVACQASACGAPPVNDELCHIGGPACSNGGTCVTAFGSANDLPRTLDVCR
jgi:hypothetical protein